MSGMEIGVIVLGLLLGYWLVSYFLKPGAPAAPPAAPAEPTSDHVSSPSPPSWHEVLELAPDASVEAIRAAYFRLAEPYRPERVQALPAVLQAEAARQRERLDEAYQQALRSRGDAP